MCAPVANLTGSICPTTLQLTTPRSNASDPPWWLRSKPLAECARFLRALPHDTTSPDAVLVSRIRRGAGCTILVRLAHSGMAAGALAESLRVASETRRSYADVCSGGGARGANGQRLPRHPAPNLARGGTKTSTAQLSAPTTSADSPPGVSPANAAWIPARCIILRPQAQDARKAPTRIQAFVQAAEIFSRKKFRNLVRIPQGKVIELACCTRRMENTFCSFGLRYGRSSNCSSPQTLCGSWGLLLGLGTH